MRRQSSHAGYLARLLASAAVSAVLAASLGGCQTMSDVTGAIASSKTSAVPDDPRQAVDVYGERYRANPRDPVVAINYAQALRTLGQRAQAASVLEQASLVNPRHMELLGAYGNPRADGRVRQNLALVVGLQGRFAEAETIAKGDLPADEATANVAYLREMLSQKDPRGGRKPPVVALDKSE